MSIHWFFLLSRCFSWHLTRKAHLRRNEETGKDEWAIDLTADDVVAGHELFYSTKAEAKEATAVLLEHRLQKRWNASTSKDEQQPLKRHVKKPFSRDPRSG
ncbi:hypothetical protein DdX_17714 [Ditylenchus destructor]|uniref:Uncharacterized protein n=1 Tax=Ditylenchus destructor TaxID=166010 RepID=A0AAD4QYX0_9BILA|nr:hypothetical protein DdX_17714 [Ditylenchus destructor]